MALKMCRNCVLKLMNATDMFWKSTGGIDADWKKDLRKCTQLKRRWGAECYESFVEHLDTYVIEPTYRPKCDHKDCMCFRKSSDADPI